MTIAKRRATLQIVNIVEAYLLSFMGRSSLQFRPDVGIERQVAVELRIQAQGACPTRPSSRRLRHGQIDQTGPILRRCLLYTSPSPRDRTRSRMPSSA